MTFMYDDEEDILYAFTKNVDGCTYSAVGDGIYIRIDPVTKQPTGFMVLRFKERTGRNPVIAIPHFSSVSIPPLESITM